MQDDVNELLPPAERLALAYAPSGSKRAIAAIFQLDARLAHAAMGASEPIIAQLKLAWWRERLGGAGDTGPIGEPLLERLTELGLLQPGLCEMVDGWEQVAVAEHGHCDWPAWARKRAAGWGVVTETLAGPEWRSAALLAGSRWAIADLAARTTNESERQSLLDAGRTIGSVPAPLPKAVRPFAVLDALARRSLDRSEAPLAHPSAMALAMRVGIFGR